MSDLAIVMCLHANPALAMSSLISIFLQETECCDIDLHFIYNVGPDREYPDMKDKGANRQLSTYDETVEEVTQIRYPRTYRWRFQNDHALDSGAWWKWILSPEQPWRGYRYVWFWGEGVVCTSESSLCETIAFADGCKANFIAPGHEKRRIPKEVFLERYNHVEEAVGDLEAFHNTMIPRVFGIFERDPMFGPLMAAWEGKFDCSEEQILEHRPGDSLRYEEEVEFEWYGCSTSNFMSRDLLITIRERAEKFAFGDALEVPFSGTALEVIWGFLPSAYGVKKYFTDAVYRPRKQKPFQPYKMRVDTPEGYCRFLRVFFGRDISVKPRGKMVQITWVGRRGRQLVERLPACYFARPWQKGMLDWLGLSHWKIYSRRDWMFVKGRVGPRVRAGLSRARNRVVGRLRRRSTSVTT